MKEKGKDKILGKKQNILNDTSLTMHWMKMKFI